MSGSFFKKPRFPAGFFVSPSPAGAGKRLQRGNVVWGQIGIFCYLGKRYAPGLHPPGYFQL
jgi:hypothetical protein